MDSDAWSSDDEPLSNASSPPASQRSLSGSAAPGGGGLSIGHVLPEPYNITYNIKTLCDMLWNAQINLDPDYQRDVVWTDSKQSMLIDSLLHNYYIPPIILAKRTGPKGTEWTCIDGKQRLTSISRFMQGSIPYRDKAHKTSWYYKVTPDKKSRKPLPDHVRQTFDGKQIICMIYQGIHEEDERDVFQRVQMGMALKKDEKWNALLGLRPDLVRKILTQYVSSERGGLGALLPWDTERSKDFSCVADALCRISHLPGTGKNVEAWLNLDVDSIDPTFERHVNEVFKIFLLLAKNPTHCKVFKSHAKALAPIEFIMTAVLISKFMDKLSLPGLAAAIDGMRKEVRAAHRDIKNNTRVQNTAWGYLNKKVATPDIPRASTALAGLKRDRSESPDAPLAQLFQKKLKTGPSTSTSTSASFAMPAPPPPLPTLSQSQSSTSSQPSTRFAFPRLRSPSLASVVGTEPSTPPPPSPTPTPAPAPTSTSTFDPDEDIKPTIPHSSMTGSGAGSGRFAFRPSPAPPRMAHAGPLRSALAEARLAFPADGLLGQRKPLFLSRTSTSSANSDNAKNES